jgi:hypothetical protein
MGQQDVPAEPRLGFSWPPLAAAVIGIIPSFASAVTVGRGENWSNKVEFNVPPATKRSFFRAA